nr:viral unique short region 6 [Cressdnaviricota sp.]
MNYKKVIYFFILLYLFCTITKAISLINYICCVKGSQLWRQICRCIKSEPNSPKFDKKKFPVTYP